MAMSRWAMALAICAFCGFAPRCQCPCFHGTGAVQEALDVEVHDFNAQLFHVRHHVFRDLLGHALAVLHHFLQAYGAHDFTHVSFQNLGHQEMSSLCSMLSRVSAARRSKASSEETLTLATPSTLTLINSLVGTASRS